MANETLTIEQNDARLTVIGKSWADVTTDSGDGITIDQLVIGEIEDITGIDLPDIDDGTRIIIGYDDSGDPWLYIDGLDDPYDLGDLDLDLLDLDFELGSSLVIGDLDVSVDDDLKIKEEELPTSIEIVTLPKKLRYVEGSRIDLSGMVVTAKKEDGSTWTSAKYPNGHIPLGELIVDPMTATEHGQMEYNITGGFFCHMSTNLFDRTFTKTSFGRAYAGLLIEPNGWNSPVIVSDNEAAVRWHCEDTLSPGFTRDLGVTGIRTVHGLTVYYGYGYGLREDTSGTGLSASGISSYYGSLEGLLESIIEGDGENQVTIRWRRPGDGIELSATFDIEVIPRGHGGGR